MPGLAIGKTAQRETISLPLQFANRHGLVTGSTGTGKTVTLQRMAEEFSRAGVPVFAADVKGDLSGIAAAGADDSKAATLARHMELACTPEAFPVRFWDVHRRHGLPVQTSVDRMGPLILARMLGLNQIQEGTLAIAFKRAADQGHGLLSLDDLRSQLADMLEMRAETCQRYGNITASSISAIQREILALEAQGATDLFAEPGLDIRDLMKTDERGRGVVNLLHADTLMEAPKLYACTLLWLLTELFRVLPEAGDLDKPKLVFFFDEAHLLFRDAPAKLLETIERVVRLVRSKGIGVFFVTQSPLDVPDAVLAQLGNRVQHSLRAYTPRDQRMVKASAKAFRPNKGVDAEKLITTMPIGSALVSFLQANGEPDPVRYAKVLPPSGQIGPISDLEREAILIADPMRSRYTPDPDEFAMARAFQRRWRGERGLPEPAAAAEYREGDWYAYVPVLEPERAPSRFGGLAWNAALFVGCFWIAAKLL